MPARKKKPNWTPSPFDALNLAALRYYAMSIEQVCISIYASDRHQALFPKMEKLLAETVHELRELGQQSNLSSGGDCADGYVLCPDGLCHPPDTCS